MSRPQSMPDFTALMDSSKSLFEQTTTSNFERRIHSRRQTSPERRTQQTRKKPSISLAAGLMMNTESPLVTGSMSPRKGSGSRPPEEGRVETEEGDTLFYAYAKRSDYPSSPPYILTFASAAVCSQWWHLVQQNYPSSARRPSPQFFIMRSEDIELIQDDLKFFDLRNKWFYSSQDSPTCPPVVLPIQHSNGTLALPPSPLPSEEKPNTSALDSLAESLTRLANIVETNAEQVHALSVAQSTGLQAMQEINESNSIQIKAISASQLKLQSLVDQNASHYIALSNKHFESQESTRQAQEHSQKAQDEAKNLLTSTLSHVNSLAKAQSDLAQTCQSMMQSFESFTHNNHSMVGSDAASSHSLGSTTSSGVLASRISPPPRKLNRRVKGVWYEYDNSVPGTTGTGTTMVRKRADSVGVETPPKSPVVFKS
ncbi:hypothetical protein COCSADRAFT_76734 [Bipolaris sorokiniana ND90Pr]|uniref:Uncharacterized protein n=1 Tax=Cochliobolus sativus (strain ND90Pr / ATCC 201652) TaxID=665912 RepID=M2SRV2_COCSN|nr:uncharacterized protein COCSADRAFT_76734 [Bipolaris sorokiniana ND90Pr]EMD69958.1 hypothetical protein COCSADRAFT_76734 [Bipolaris sorokiniana ND90Pr]